MLNHVKFAIENQLKFLGIFPALHKADSVVLLKAQSHMNRKWTDAELPFRQESNFWYLTGCNQADFYLTIDLESGASTLFLPAYEADYALWHGNPPTCSEIHQQFTWASQCLVVSDLASHLEKFKTVHVVERNEVASLSLPSTLQINDAVLMDALQESRVVKSDLEVELMQNACNISSQAHVNLMKEIKKTFNQGLSERHYSAYFAHECGKQGGFIQAYGSIVGAGVRGAVLHSSPLEEAITCQGQDLMLVDAGCEFQYYASDITRTFPFNGKFVDEYRDIYEIVLEANKTVISTMKVGTKWEDMHRLAEEIILQGLIKCGILQGDVADLRKHKLAALFFPHGLGHLLGLDVHDSPKVAYPKGVERIPEPGIKYLRMRRDLVAGMVVTVEPGLYFVDAILQQALDDANLKKFINQDKLNQYRKVGGVRIEDDCLVRSDGILVLSRDCPKEIAEIEALMA